MAGSQGHWPAEPTTSAARGWPWVRCGRRRLWTRRRALFFWDGGALARTQTKAGGGRRAGMGQWRCEAVTSVAPSRTGGCSRTRALLAISCESRQIIRRVGQGGQAKIMGMVLWERGWNGRRARRRARQRHSSTTDECPGSSGACEGVCRVDLAIKRPIPTRAHLKGVGRGPGRLVLVVDGRGERAGLAHTHPSPWLMECGGEGGGGQSKSSRGSDACRQTVKAGSQGRQTEGKADGVCACMYRQTDCSGQYSSNYVRSKAADKLPVGATAQK